MRLCGCWLGGHGADHACVSRVVEGASVDPALSRGHIRVSVTFSSQAVNDGITLL